MVVNDTLDNASPGLIVVLISIPLFILYVVVWVLASTGFTQIQICFNRSAQKNLENEVRSHDLEAVTILRPLKGIDSQMEWCLESSFKQEYPHDKLEIIFCVQSEYDPAIPIVQRLITKYPNIDSKLLIDEDQQNLDNFGPNPKVNNLHKGYQSAKHDILWVLDSNVFTYPQTLKRSIHTLKNNINNGSNIPTIMGQRKTVKLVTHIPIVVSTSKHQFNWGAKLDEMFMSTSHSKFYAALNRIQPAPCVNGKSNLYRRSDLDTAVENITNQRVLKGDGFKHFAKYIGEDNMIGIALWEGVNGCAGMSKDIVVQPVSGQNSVRDYIDRRVRWLRVRKYMVLAATMLEPATESLLSGLIGSFTINVLFNGTTRINWVWYMFHMMIWLVIDYFQYLTIFNLSNEALDVARKFQFQRFIRFWILREILAFPIWLIAMCGSGIDWRGQPFKILPDLSAERL